jgi:hypothetical protein
VTPAAGELTDPTCGAPVEAGRRRRKTPRVPRFAFFKLDHGTAAPQRTRLRHRLDSILKSSNKSKIELLVEFCK